MVSKLRIIVTGLLAQFPLGGLSWHYLQYLVGAARLGHDVFYLEDSGQYPYNPIEKGLTNTCDFNVSHLNQTLSRYGLEQNWAYRFPWQSEWFGMPDSLRKEVIETADLLINVSGSLASVQPYRSSKCLVYVDTDPVFTQVKLARGQHDFRRLIMDHDCCFSFGEHVSRAFPETGIDWMPTRQPIVLSEWQARGSCRDAYTTVMNWTSYNDVRFNGQTYGQKDAEFKRFVNLPGRVAPIRLELALNEGKTRRSPRRLLERYGWHLVDPDKVCCSYDDYRNYIQQSRGEWTVAKQGYVVGQAGWFSERSACYLAAGKPVVTQDTGFTDILPTGNGLFAFRSLDEAVQALETVEANYRQHCEAARSIAEDYFDSSRIIQDLLERSID